MHTVWSDMVQGVGTLYLSRALRFSDLFRKKYMEAFRIEDGMRMLEVGCGPGALLEALGRWYPKAERVGLDRDSRFVRFASERVPGARIMEGDATALPFGDESFDVCISNTVQEHIEPAAFFGEQLRVLRPGGVCLVLSARKGFNHFAPCLMEETEFEKEIGKRMDVCFEGLNARLGVCGYPMTERELPAAMEKHGFREVSVDYLTISLTPDDPRYDRQTAVAMIEANRRMSLECADNMLRIAPEAFSEEEIAELKRLRNERYDRRIAQYDAGEKQWDANVSVTMVVRGVK